MCSLRKSNIPNFKIFETSEARPGVPLDLSQMIFLNPYKQKLDSFSQTESVTNKLTVSILYLQILPGQNEVLKANYSTQNS